MALKSSKKKRICSLLLTGVMLDLWRQHQFLKKKQKVNR